MKYLIYILTILSFAASSCQDYESDIDIAPSESKLVISAFLSPRDTVTFFYITKTQPTLGGSGEDPFIKNAKVIFSDGTFSDTITYRNDTSLFIEGYFTRRDIEHGKTYTVTAIADGMTASGVCTVLPESPLDFNYTVDSIILKDEIKFIVKMEWTDSSIVIPQTYYRTDVELQYIELGDIFQFGSENLSSANGHIHVGKGFNNKMQVVYESSYIPRNSIKFIDMHLFMIDQDYYKFEKSEKGSFGIGFNTEPINVYTNIKGGFGIVASFNNYALKNLNFQ